MDSQELIKDRALTVGEDDLFDHKSISESIVNLLRSVSPPANIALYGPWGIGKSGLSNLIEARLLELNEGYKYVRFDAFKYAENPLRKHILSVMSDALLCDSESKEFKETLYKSESTEKIKIPPVTILSMIATMIIVMVAIAMAFSLLAGLFTLHENGVELGYLEKVGKYIPQMILPSSILSAFVTLWGKTFTTNIAKSAPSEEEEFEHHFQRLIKKVTPLPTHKVVIFVDELDRCAGGDVVAALDTIRTFMDSRKCMFIVAVDRHVLSASFRAKSSSASPLDKNNPQHGSVNEYLNKVFQYQIDMPPLKPQRLTAYANDLVKERGGVWSSNLFKPKEVVSILIPPSVTSPRRVKSLLNSFVVAFRIVSDKARQGRIRPLDESMIRSLAKIVFIRNEYPKFFEHVCLEHRLPSILVNAYKSEAYEMPLDIKDDVADLVTKYIKHEIELYDYLSTDNYSDSHKVDQRELIRASGKHLLNYLSMTSHIDIERELIFLEGVDPTNGLEPEFAADLESLAISNLTQELNEKISPLTRKDKERIFPLLLNNTPLHDYEHTLQGQNVAITILELVKEDQLLALDNRAEIVDKTLPYLVKFPESSHDAFIGLVKLTEDIDYSRKERVFESVLSTEVLFSNGELASLIMSLAADTPKQFDHSYSKILSVYYNDEIWNVIIFTELAEMPENKSRRILSASLPEIREAYLASKDTDNEDSHQEEIPTELIIESMKSAVKVFLDKGREDLVERALWFLDDEQDAEWFRFILHLMRSGWKPTSKKLAHNLLSNYGYFAASPTDVRSVWLEAMNPDLFDPQNDAELFDEIEEQILSDFNKYGSEEKYFQELFPQSLHSLQEFKQAVKFKEPSEKLTNEIIEQFESKIQTKVVSQPSLDASKLWFLMMRVFSNYNLIVDPQKVSDAVLQASIKHLASPGVQINPQIRSTIVKFLSECIIDVLPKASLQELKDTGDALNSQNLIPTERELVYLKIAIEGRIKEIDLSQRTAPYDDTYIISLMNGNNFLLIQKIASSWIQYFPPDVDSFFDLIINFRKRAMFNKEFLKSIDEYLSALSDSDHKRILSMLLKMDAQNLGQHFVGLLGFSALDDEYIEKELIKAAKNCHNINDRKRVLYIWKAANLKDTRVIDNLAIRVFLKFYKENKTSAGLALRSFDLISNISKDTQKRLSKELLKVKDKTLNNRASKILDRYGFN